MKISFLCVTQDRPEFMPWLLWNYDRQAWPDKELVIVDSSETPFATKQKDVRIIPAPGANVPAKRNIALREAAGEYVTWLDDDDWRHPDSAKDLLAVMAENEVDMAGGRVAWFVDLLSEGSKRLVMRREFLFAAALVKTSVARSVAFEEDIERGSDIAWIDILIQSQSFAFSYECPSLFLCHDSNLGNRIQLHHFNRRLSDAQEVIGKKAWGKTSEQLKQLRERLGNR